MKKNILKILTSTLLILLLIFLTSINWWGCKIQNVIEPPSSISVSQIANEIANADTQEKAVIAIQHIIQKVGLGVNAEETRYGKFIVGDSTLNSIAYAQSRFINGDSTMSLGVLYDSIRSMYNFYNEITNGIFTLGGNKNSSFIILQKNSQIALNSPENRENSLLLLINQINGNIPEQIPLLDSTSIVSPIQAFLFALWVATQFEQINQNSDNEILCMIQCMANHIIVQLGCYGFLALPVLGIAACAICIVANNVNTAICLYNCHQQGGG